MAQRPRPSLRFADGGIVPGTGRGDKIPAKYEPGEFVVSNDMIDDNPGLREQLSGLRAETLAARGKTVEEADAQVLNGGRRPSLRAAEGFDPLSRMAKDLTGQNPLPPRSPVGNMADDLSRNARAAVPEGPAVRPTAPLPPEAAAAYNSSPEGRATKAQVLKDTQGYFQGKPSAAAAPAGASAPPSAPATPGATPSATKPGLTARAIGATSSGLRTAAGFAAKASNAIGGTVGAVQSLRDIDTGYRDQFAQSIGAEDAGPWGAAATDIFRTAANVGNAITGGLAESLGRGVSDYISGGSFQEGWKQPTSRDAFEAARERPAGQSPAGQSPAAPDPRNPYADANAAKIAASDAQNAAAGQPRTPGQNDVRRIDRPGQSPLFTNMPDGGLLGNDKLMARGAISAQNRAAMDNLAASGDITPRLRAQAQYDAEVANAQRINAMQQRLYGAGSNAAMLDLRSPENLAARNASVTSTISRDGRPRLRSEVEAETARTKMALDAQSAKMQNQTTQRGQDINAETSRYSSDSSLRGTMYSSDSQLGAKRTEMERSLRQQATMGKLWEMSQGKPEVFRNLAMQAGLTDAAKLGGDMAAADQTRTLKNVEDARDTFKDLFTTPDDKTDKNAEANAHVMAAKIVPGWENMSAEQRAANRTKVVDAVKLVQGMNATKDTGWLQKIGLDNPNGAHSQLPELADKNGKRAQVGDVGWWEGVTTPNVSRGDTVITLPNGTKRYLRGQLEESQAALLEQNGAQRQR